MPTLHWIGKDKVINHHLDVPFKVLEHSYGFDNGEQTQQDGVVYFWFTLFANFCCLIFKLFVIFFEPLRFKISGKFIV